MLLSAGNKLGPYEILGPLGAGGMGEVYRAEDRRLHRTVAIKVLPHDKFADEERKQRFLREARAASALMHSNIVVLYDISSSEGMDFLVMEFVAGQTLKERIQQRALPAQEVIHLGTQIASALAAAHAAGIVHRDIKPANIMVTPQEQIKVLDFGLAKLAEPAIGLEAETRTTLGATEAGVVMGTVAYMSPEQTRAEPLDGRSDVFSLGCVLYEAATGRLPFRGASTLAVMIEIASAKHVPPSELKRELPAEFDGVIERALAKDKQDRYESMAEMREALLALAPGAATHSRARARSSGGKRKKWWIAASIAAVLLAAGAVYEWRRPKAHVPDPQAYQLYLQGRHDLQEFTEHGFRQSIVDFSNAIRRDPEFAAAYAGLADAYSFQATFELARPREVMPLAENNAAIALELDPQQAGAYTSLGIVSLAYEWNYPRARQRFQKSLAINSRDAFTQHFLGHYYELMGRWPDAVKQMQLALELEKLSPMYGEDLGYDLFVVGRTGEALRQLRETVGLAPQDPFALSLLALVLESAGQGAESLEQAKNALMLPGVLEAAGSLSGVLCRLQRTDLAREILGKLEAAEKTGTYVAPLEIAMTQFALGDKARGFARLRDAVSEHCFNIGFDLADPVFDSVREDPEFAASINDMHLLPACWREVPRYKK